MEADQIRSWLQGPMVAVATPFAEDFALDLHTLHDNIRFIIDHGIRTGQGSLLVGGAGGEHPTLSVEERKAVMDVGVEAAQGEAPVVTSIQHTDVRAIVEMAQHAEKAGLQGVQLGPTYYYASSEPDALRLYQRVAEASDVSIMVYNTWWEGLDMSLDLLRRIAEIETVRALKWDTPDHDTYRDGIVIFANDLVVIDNKDEHILSHMLGARGFIAHLGGCWPEYSLKIWQLLEQRDYAAAAETLASFKWGWRRWTTKVAEVTAGEGPIIKAPMEEVGLRVGPPRPPAIRPPEHLLTELRELMRSAGVPGLRVA